MIDHMLAKIVGSISALLVAGSIFYYLVIFLPEKNKQEMEQKSNSATVNLIQSASNKQDLENCLDNVQKKFANAFSNEKDSPLKGLSVDNQKYAIDLILKLEQQQKDDCYKQYSQK